MRPSKLTKKLLYPTLGLLTISGITWIIAHYFMQIRGEFGLEMHPLETWSLRLHGLFGLCTLIWLGMLVEHHMLSYFRQKRHLYTGLTLAILSIWLTLSGYMLYYLSEDNWRNVFSLGHWIVGLVATASFWVHLVSRKY